ncbi:MFS transporter [Acidimangrovimonas sediminis]|uniref:MFS transporter n=1 Tax=Acidimangrovimonas sediminis TaxID=2056283 RepID=UPI000C7FCA79|nr:MFS transporter [Acidimangrovimonas sediminis]
MRDIATDGRHTARHLRARLDRLQVWSMAPAFLGIIGLGFLFTFYDIFDINVSFIQTCTQLVPGCTPESTVNWIGLPVLLNLAGYVVGTLALSPVADRIGRRNMLMITMLITGLGSLYTALAPTYAHFVMSRVVTGVGIGADLAIVNTYINEVAPRRARARFATVIFIMSALGAFLGIWLGLFLTTPAAPWPMGLPFAIGGEGFAAGWRWMYGVGAILAGVAILMRVKLPESAQWLIQADRLDEAHAVVTGMETRAALKGPLAEPDTAAMPDEIPRMSATPFRDLFGNPLYLRRLILLLGVWFIGYITVYGFAAGFTSVLTSLHYPPPEAGVIAAVGTLGFIAEAVIMSWIVERMERRYWLPVGAVVTLAGAGLIAVAGVHVGMAFAGSILVFAGFNLWVSPTYALTAEMFPTRAHSTGFALVDGIGHLGGGFGIMVIAPLLPRMSVLGALMLVSGFLVVAAVLVQFTLHTRNRHLHEVSP